MSEIYDMEPSKRTRFLNSAVLLAFLLLAGLVFRRESLAEESKEVVLYNSQTIPILKSSGAIAEAAPLVLEQGVFLADVGPLGASYEAAPAGGTIVRYRVRPGDTIEGIAELFDVSKNTILWANDLMRGSTLSIDQELIILPVSGVRYVTTKESESVSAIAKRFDGDRDEIIRYNGLESDTLARGVTLIIPDGELATLPSVGEIIPKKLVPRGEKSAPTPSTASKKLPVRVSVAELSDASGFFELPLRTGIRTQRSHGYNGVDIGVPIGTPVYAAASGTVIVAKSSGYNGGYGIYVVVAHENGTQTLYAHLSKNLVTEGSAVRKGEQIALSGNTGKSTGPHLHFEVRGRGAKNFLNQ